MFDFVYSVHFCECMTWTVKQFIVQRILILQGPLRTSSFHCMAIWPFESTPKKKWEVPNFKQYCCQCLTIFLVYHTSYQPLNRVRSSRLPNLKWVLIFGFFFRSLIKLFLHYTTVEAVASQASFSLNDMKKHKVRFIIVYIVYITAVDA